MVEQTGRDDPGRQMRMERDETMNAEQWPSTGHGEQSQTRPARKENALTRFVATAGFLLNASTRRPGGRRVWWTAVTGLTIGGMILIAMPFVTTIVAHRLQNGAKKEFASTSLKDAFRTATGGKIKLGQGDALTRLKIPKLHVDIIVVEGTSGNALRYGAGHYEFSALPGDVGNVAIFGHRTGFGEPFRHIEQLSPGDVVTLDTPIGKYTYKVLPEPFDGHPNPWITRSTDWSITAPTPTPMLTLISCDPPHTSKNRIAVRAELVNSQTLS